MFSFYCTLTSPLQHRILAMTKDVSSSVTLEMILEKHKAPSKLALSSDLTLGKVKCSAEAIRAALQKLEGGSSVQDAKAVCGTDLLIKVTKWKNKLNVYLGPFLHGPRYTSFGRHFTKDDKLKEIVKMLHWYVEDGDMIVDFCCGSNDFSCIMKKKLDDVRKNCSYKNYDIFQAKNDFSFERRDWMEVRPEELPSGSQLIMGLNPPFGVNADKLINKALEFKPKLLILIVPRKTQRLDEKEFPYDLIWENDQLLMGKSFYLPGSIDINGKRTKDWNVKPPPLPLWSHPDWTSKHKAIARKHGHSSGIQEKIRSEETTGGEAGLPLDCSETNSNKQCGGGQDHSITNSKVARERKLERPPKSIARRSSTSEVNVKHAPDVDGRTQKVQGTQAPDCRNERTYSLSNTTLANPGLSSLQGEQVPPAKITYGGGMITAALGAPSADSSGTYHSAVPRPKASSFNFAPGPCHPAQSNSGGWLDD